MNNAGAQYWARTDANGNAQITGVRPGQYRLTLYQNELEVAHSAVWASAGNLTKAALSAELPTGQVKWQIGLPDGTPAGFLNAARLSSAHPSDSRMLPWAPVTYTIGTSKPADFPAAQWREINSPTHINFTLGPGDVRDYRLRLYISLAQAGGRPQVIVNQTWHAPVAAASNQPDSRGITRGTYRGNNMLFDIAVPRTALHTGVNSLEIGVASGKAGTGFLSPGFVYDSVQWVEQ